MAPTPATTARETVKVSSPEAYVGDYEVGGGVAVLEVSVKDGTLYLQAPRQQAIAMESYADGSFGIPLAGATIEFQGDVASGITGLELSQAGNVTRATKN